MNQADLKKIQVILDIIDLDVLFQVAQRFQDVKAIGYGDVTIQLREGRFAIVAVTTTEKLHPPRLK